MAERTICSKCGKEVPVNYKGECAECEDSIVKFAAKDGVLLRIKTLLRDNEYYRGELKKSQLEIERLSEEVVKGFNEYRKLEEKVKVAEKELEGWKKYGYAESEKLNAITEFMHEAGKRRPCNYDKNSVENLIAYCVELEKVLRELEAEECVIEQERNALRVELEFLRDKHADLQVKYNKRKVEGFAAAYKIPRISEMSAKKAAFMKEVDFKDLETRVMAAKEAEIKEIDMKAFYDVTLGEPYDSKSSESKKIIDEAIKGAMEAAKGLVPRVDYW